MSDFSPMEQEDENQEMANEDKNNEMNQHDDLVQEDEKVSMFINVNVFIFYFLEAAESKISQRVKDLVATLVRSLIFILVDIHIVFVFCF